MSDSVQIYSKETFEQKSTEFHYLFSKYQRDITENNNYIEHQAFKDLKIIIGLYAETRHQRGYNYNDLKLAHFQELTKYFDCFQQYELFNYLSKQLIAEGSENKAKELSSYLNFLKLKCTWENVKSKKSLKSNLPLLIHRVSSYNLLTLLLTLVVYFVVISIIYSNAPQTWMEVISIKKINISDSYLLNHLLNTLTYIFDLDGKMEIMPLNLSGTLLLIFNKIIFIMIVLNYIIKEIFTRIKLN